MSIADDLWNLNEQAKAEDKRRGKRCSWCGIKAADTKSGQSIVSGGKTYCSKCAGMLALKKD